MCVDPHTFTAGVVFTEGTKDKLDTEKLLELHTVSMLIKVTKVVHEIDMIVESHT